jgi:hypothetical protein
MWAGVSSVLSNSSFTLLKLYSLLINFYINNYKKKIFAII